MVALTGLTSFNFWLLSSALDALQEIKIANETKKFNILSIVPQLGDGRAHFLGEVEVGENNSFEIQLKGSGKTKYSRFGDGKSVLRSSIREYIAAEALHNLAIPSTRSLCIIGSDEDVAREAMEKAAMVTRVSESFIRFGHFEYFTNSGRTHLTKKLADYVIKKHFPKIIDDDNKYEKLFYRVVKSTASMIAKWQAVGFTHGVMNTDNMSILGQTIDYGPFGFMDNFDPNYVPNHSDHTARYSFQSQPSIALWNLQALAYAFEPLVKLDDSMEILELYKNLIIKEYNEIMRSKLGLREECKSDQILISSLLNILFYEQVDYTIFFRKLSDIKIDSNNPEIYGLFKNETSFKEWQKQYFERVKKESWPVLNKKEKEFYSNRKKTMDLVNPKYIPRNYLLEVAIQQASYAGDFSEVEKLFNLFQNPYDEHPEFESYAALPPSWASEINLSCSS